MVVLSTLKGLKTGKGLCADAVLGKHSLNSELHSQIRAGSHKSLVLNLFKTADVSGVMTVVLIGKLLTGENCLIGVDYYNVIAAVNVGSVICAVLTVKDYSCLSRNSTEGLACCVNYIPLAIKCFYFCSSTNCFFIIFYSKTLSLSSPRVPSVESTTLSSQS